MADRSVVYRLIADASRFKSGMNDAARSSDQTAASLDKTSKSTGKVSEGMDLMGISAGTAAAAIGAKVVMSAANFEQAMSSIQAATRASAGDMALMEQAALDAGASTAFSATEAAAGIENLAKAGVSTADILNGGLSGALDLAAAGQLEVGQAAEIAATAMTQFNLAGSDVDRVADALAAGAGKAQGEVTDLAQALNQSGLVAGQMGLSLEETTGTLAAFASAGLLGSDAGTSLKTMLLRLANPSNEAAKAMEQFGISAYDANGNMVNTATLAGQLQTAFSGQSQATRDAALATIFGSDAIRAANVLYSEGEAGVSGWTAEVSDSGYAAETAAIQMDNLKGRFEELMGALETAQIGQGEGALGPLSALLSGATAATNGFNKLNDATDGWVTSLAGGPLTQFPRMFDDIKTAMEGPKNEGTAFVDMLSNASGGMSTAEGRAAALSSKTDDLGNALSGAESEAENFKDTLDALNSALDGRASFRDYEAAIDEFTASLKENGRTFDINTNKGRANQAALDNIAQSALNVAESLSVADRRKFLTTAINDLRTMGQSMGLPKREVNALIELLRQANNTDVKPNIDANTADAQSKVAALKNSIEALRDRSLTITTVYKVVGNATDALPARANGGPIYGPGTKTSDSIPAMLSTGEYVIRAAAVDKYGLGFFDQANSMRLAGGGSPDKRRRKNNLGGDDSMESTTDNSVWDRRMFAMLNGAAEAAARQENAAEMALQAAEDQAKAAEDNLSAAEGQLSATQQLSASFAGSVSSQFSNSLTGGGLAGLGRTLSQDIAGGAAFQSTLDGLIAGGLDTTGPSAGLFQELAASGDLTTANQLLAAGPEAIAQYEAMFAQREAQNLSRGEMAAQASYGEMIAQQTATVAAAEAQVVQLQNIVTQRESQHAQMTTQVQALTQAVQQQAEQFGNVINRTSTSAAQSRPSGVSQAGRWR